GNITRNPPGANSVMRYRLVLFRFHLPGFGDCLVASGPPSPQPGRGGGSRQREGEGRSALMICSGLTGVALNSTPNGDSASQIALAIAAGGATAPPSPTPLTPSGLSGDGVCWCAIAMSGTSLAVGTR